MIKKLTDIVKENWAVIIPTVTSVYGSIKCCLGISNAKIGDVTTGTYIIGLSGAAFLILDKLPKYLQR